MTIFRKRQLGSFTVIGNEPMDDENLSAEALGVLCYLRSKPDNWQVLPKQLAKRFNCGKDRMYGILKDLISFRYIHRIRVFDQVSGQFIRFDYVVYDDPGEPLPENAETGREVADLPDTEKPFPGNPKAENPDTLIKTDLLPSKESEQVVMPTNRVDSKNRAEKFFDEVFWPEVPRRDGRNPKEPCRKKIVAAIISGENPDQILEGIRRLAQFYRARREVGTRFVPMAVTWANQKGWHDDPMPNQPPPSPQGGGGRQQSSFFSVAAEIRGTRESER